MSRSSLVAIHDSWTEWDDRLIARETYCSYHPPPGGEWKGGEGSGVEQSVEERRGEDSRGEERSLVD